MCRFGSSCSDTGAGCVVDMVMTVLFGGRGIKSWRVVRRFGEMVSGNSVDRLTACPTPQRAQNVHHLRVVLFLLFDRPGDDAIPVGAGRMWRVKHVVVGGVQLLERREVRWSSIGEQKRKHPDPETAQDVSLLLDRQPFGDLLHSEKGRDEVQEDEVTWRGKV